MGMGESMEISWIRHSSLKAKSQEVFQEPSLWRQVVTETALHGTEPSLIIKKKNRPTFRPLLLSLSKKIHNRCDEVQIFNVPRAFSPGKLTFPSASKFCVLSSFANVNTLTCQTMASA